MARVTIEKCLEKIGSHFDLVLIAVERAKQISNGKKSEIMKKGIKTHVTALREIEEGVLNIKDMRTGLSSVLNNINQDEDDRAKGDDDMVEEVQSSDFIHGELEEIGSEASIFGSDDNDTFFDAEEYINSFEEDIFDLDETPTEDKEPEDKGKE